MRIGCLVDTTRCVGCRSCQVACKQSNGLPAEKTEFFAAPGGYQNPRKFSPRTYTYISFHGLEDDAGRPKWVFVKRQCLHCAEMYCSHVCAPGVYHRKENGVVACRENQCIGCAACVDACPFGVPAVEYWDLPTPQVRKCVFCLTRQQSLIPSQLDGKPLAAADLERYRKSLHTPACAKACPTGAILFGQRDKLLEEAHRRIAARPGHYVDHIYGETEAGGTSWLYLASVPFEQLGFPSTFPNRESLHGMERLGATRHRGEGTA